MRLAKHQPFSSEADNTTVLVLKPEVETSKSSETIADSSFSVVHIVQLARPADELPLLALL